MAQRFDSISAFAAHMGRLVQTLPAAETRAVTGASAVILAEARSIPGHYQSAVGPAPAWPALAESTRRDRVRKGFTPDDPLLRTGELARSYQSKVTSPRSAEVGSDDPRAPLFEFGTSRMPPRPVLLTAAVRKEPETHLIAGQAIFTHLTGRANVSGSYAGED